MQISGENHTNGLSSPHLGNFFKEVIGLVVQWIDNVAPGAGYLMLTQPNHLNRLSGTLFMIDLFFPITIDGSSFNIVASCLALFLDDPFRLTQGAWS